MNAWKQPGRLSGITVVVCTALGLALLASGCGKKTAPRPILEVPPPQVKDLNAEVRNAGVELTWSIPDFNRESTETYSYGFAVMKSEVPWDKRNCLECPVPEADQQILQRIDLTYPEPADAPQQNLTVVDTQVSANHAYRYQVAFRDNKDRVLSLSNPVIAKVVTPPPPPLDFTAGKQAEGIQLHWKVPKKNVQQQSINGEVQFEVQRRSMEGTWESISPAPVKGDSFFDSAVASNRLYDYRVFSVLSFEGTPIISEPSPVRQVKAPGALPPPPPGTVWVIPAGGNLEVNWTPSDGKVKGYHVYRREGKEITRLTANPVEKPPYVDKSVKPNVIYFYAVSAVGVEPPYPEGLLSKWQEIRNIQFK